MSSLAEIEAAAESLSPDEQEQLVARLGAKLAARKKKPLAGGTRAEALERWFAEIDAEMRKLPPHPTPREILEEGRNRLERF